MKWLKNEEGGDGGNRNKEIGWLGPIINKKKERNLKKCTYISIHNLIK